MVGRRGKIRGLRTRRGKKGEGNEEEVDFLLSPSFLLRWKGGGEEERVGGGTLFMLAEAAAEEEEEKVGRGGKRRVHGSQSLSFQAVRSRGKVSPSKELNSPMSVWCWQLKMICLLTKSL